MIGGGFVEGAQYRYRLRWRDPTAEAGTFVDTADIRGNLNSTLIDSSAGDGDTPLSPMLYFQFDDVQAGGAVPMRDVLEVLESEIGEGDYVDDQDGVGGQSGRVVLRRLNRPLALRRVQPQGEWPVQRWEKTETDGQTIVRVYLSGTSEVRPHYPATGEAE